MRFASKLMLLALLALPVGSVLAAVQDTLTVTIKVTVAVEVNVEFADDASVQKTWTINNAALATPYTASAAPYNLKLQIKNNRAFAVNVTAAVTDPTFWQSAVAVGADDKFTVVTKPVTAPTPLVAGGPRTYQTIAGNGSSAADDDITLTLPTTVTHIQPGSDIVITYVAGAQP